MPLTARDRAILDFERTWWLRPGTKGTAIQASLGLSPARYYQLLGALVDSPDAEAYDPLVVRRRRKLQSTRRRARIEGRTAGQPRSR